MNLCKIAHGRRERAPTSSSQVLLPLIVVSARAPDPQIARSTGPEPATTDRLSTVPPSVQLRRNLIGEFQEERISQKAPGLPQSEITGNEEDYHHKTNNVDNTVHLTSFFLSGDRIYSILKLELILSREGLRCSIRQCEKEYLQVSRGTRFVSCQELHEGR